MSCEIQILVWSIFWGIFQLLLAAGAATQQRGISWNLSTRDAESPPLTGVAGRLSRAFENFKETYPFFIAAVLVVTLTGKSCDLTQSGAGIYLGSRVIYVAVYAFGIPYFRTLVWSGSMVGIVLMIYGAAIRCA